MTYGIVSLKAGRILQTAFQPLDIGAGGFITGIDMATDGTKVIRTDTFGAYLWSGSIWQQIVTKSAMPSGDVTVGGGQGVYEIAIAPSNTSRFYMIFNGYVYRTDNKGVSWTRTARTQDTSAAANDNIRSNNRKLAIDPQNQDFVFAVTPTLGVSFSADAGVTWTTVSTGSIPASSSNYLVAFDPSSTVSGGKTQGVYVSSYGHGIYQSTNAGASWTLTSSSPTTHSHMLVDPAGIVWLIDNSGGSADGALHKLSSGTWSAPTTGGGTILRATAVDPANPSHIYCIDAAGALYISTNTGGSFVGGTAITTSSATIPWIAAYQQANSNFLSTSNALLFDPSTTNLLFTTDGLGVRTTNPPTTNSTVAWADQSIGIEQLVANGIVRPPSGNPVVGVWDQGVFRSTSPTVFPSTHGTDLTFSACWSLDWASPSTIVALVNFGANETSGVSSDGGATWTKFSALGTPPPYLSTTGGSLGGFIAASSSTNFVMVRTDNGTNPNRPYYTTNGGALWSLCTGFTGIPTSATTGWSNNNNFNSQVLCADRVDPNTFYIINNGQGSGNTGGGVWKSTDGGATWTKVSTSVLGGSNSVWGSMKAVPGNPGQLFRSSGAGSSQGFERSTDHGATWSFVTNVSEVWVFGFGMAKPGGGGYPTIYILGYLSGVWGLYRSDDNAATWTAIGDGYPLGHWDQVTCLEGNSDVYGTFYVGFRGSGYVMGSLQ